MSENSPDFHDDADHFLHEGGVKASIKWEDSAGEYVILWYQDPFYKFGGFSMSHPLYEDILDYDHIDKLYVDSDEEGRIFLFDMQELEDGETIPSTHWAAQGDYKQHVVKMDDSTTTWKKVDQKI